jgi:hypothetical protein
MPGDLELGAPPGWVTAEEAPPSLKAGADLAVDRWSSWRPPDGGGPVEVAGCFGVDLSAWTDEATGFAQGQLAAMVAGVAARLDPSTSLHVVRTERSGHVAEQAFAAGDETNGPVVARTFLGFASLDPPRLHGCFVLCAPSSGECQQSVTAAKGTGFTEAPSASLPLRAVVTGVHHPKAVATLGVLLFLVAGAVAVWTRPGRTRK